MGGGSKWVLLVTVKIVLALVREKAECVVLGKADRRAVVGGGSKWVLLVRAKVVLAVVGGGS